MSPVQWVKPSRRPLGPRFWNPIYPTLVAFLQKPHEYAILVLHWQDAANTSVPCMGQGECLLCPHGRRVHAYTGCLRFDYGARAWIPAIIDLGDPEAALAVTDLCGKVAKLARKKKGDGRSPLLLNGTMEGPLGIPVPDCKPFDIKPHLMRRWGLFDEADRLEREAYYEQQRLPFDNPPSEKGETP